MSHTVKSAVALFLTHFIRIRSIICVLKNNNRVNCEWNK